MHSGGTEGIYDGKDYSVSSLSALDFATSVKTDSITTLLSTFLQYIPHLVLQSRHPLFEVELESLVGL